MPNAKHRFLSVAIVMLLMAAVARAPASVPSDQPDLGLCHSGPKSPISTVAAGPYKARTPEVVNLTSALDGAQIHMGLVRPALPAGRRAPVIVFASPYFVGSFSGGPVQFQSGHDLSRCSTRLVANYVSHGYAIGFVAVRGTSDSGGCEDLMGKAERSDLDQAVNWFGTRSWSNGRVGMIGVSYDGSTPWEVASLGNKYLKTIVPISGVNDMFHLMYRNGAPETRGAATLNALYYEYGFGTNNVANGRSPERVGAGVACPEAAKGFAAAAHSFATGERDPLGFWAERNLRPGVEARYKGSIFMVQGLQDWNVDPGHNLPWARSLQRKGFTVKYLVNQAGHAWPDTWSSGEIKGNPIARWDWATILLRWWDRWLKNDTSVKTGPLVEVQDSQGRWRTESSWPPARAKARTFYLTPSGSLSSSPASGSSEAPVAADPYRLSGDDRISTVCAACPTFSTGVFKDGLRFAGFPAVDLTVVPTGPGYVSAWLYGVDTAGALHRVGWGMADLRFPRGGEVAQQPIPGTPLSVRVPIEPLDVSLPAGWKLMLLVSQGGFGDGDHVSVSPMPMQLRTGEKASSVTLSTFTVGSTQFFRPPVLP